MHARAFSFLPVARIVAKSGRRARRLETARGRAPPGQFPQ
jgi:hypothetical protein